MEALLVSSTHVYIVGTKQEGSMGVCDLLPEMLSCHTTYQLVFDQASLLFEYLCCVCYNWAVATPVYSTQTYSTPVPGVTCCTCTCDMCWYLLLIY